MKPTLIVNLHHLPCRRKIKEYWEHRTELPDKNHYTERCILIWKNKACIVLTRTKKTRKSIQIKLVNVWLFFQTIFLLPVCSDQSSSKLNWTNSDTKTWLQGLYDENFIFMKTKSRVSKTTSLLAPIVPRIVQIHLLHLFHCSGPYGPSNTSGDISLWIKVVYWQDWECKHG